MLTLLFLGMMVAIIFLIVKNDALEKELASLKKLQHREVRFCPKCGFNFQNVFNKVNFCPGCGHSFIPVPHSNTNSNTNANINNNIKKNKPTEKEVKNSLILTVGAVLVVISAISFLVSTWNISGNFIKTLVLIFMLVVFFAISYIADSKLKLKQTSKTFYYIALAYIPIVFLSISMFNLFGNYLSLNGDGKYIYLTISSIIVSLIYYFNSKRRNSKTLFIFNIIFQVFSVIFFTLIFTNKIVAILLVLITYSTIISILYLNKKIYFSEKVHKNLSCVLCFSFSIVLLLRSFVNTINNNVLSADVIAFAILLINIYLVLVKILNKDIVYKFIYPLFIVLTFKNLAQLFNENMMFAQSLILASFAVVYLYNIAKEHQINLVTYVEILICFSVFYFICMFMELFGYNLMPKYILLAFLVILNFVNYVFNDKYKIFSSVMLAISIVIASISCIMYFELNYIIIGIVSFILVLISIIKNIDINLRTGFKWVGIIFLFLNTFMIEDHLNIYNLILCAIYSVVMLSYGIINKDNIYKISSYAYINIVLLNVFDIAFKNYLALIIPTTTVIITFVERIFVSIRSKATDIYLIACYIISTIILLDISGDYNNIAMLVLSLSFIYYIIHYKKNINYLSIPFIGMLPYIYFSNNLVVSEFNFMYIISILVLIGMIALIYHSKTNIYIIMFYIYNYFHLIRLEEIEYISVFILIVGSFICYLIKNNKVKDTYIAIIYILWLIFYNMVLGDVGLGNFASLSAISYIITLILITRTILKKYGDGYKIWEYVIGTLINLIVILRFSSEYDGIIYVVCLAILVIISYIYKLGPIFLICLISIVLNSIILTRIIFINIPWWIYILVIGGTLIGFAIYNEAKDTTKKDKEGIKKRLNL